MGVFVLAPGISWLYSGAIDAKEMVYIVCANTQVKVKTSENKGDLSHLKCHGNPFSSFSISFATWVSKRFVYLVTNYDETSIF